MISTVGVYMDWVFEYNEPLKSSRVRDFILSLNAEDWISFIKDVLRRGQGKLIKEGAKLRKENGLKNTPDRFITKKKPEHPVQISFPYVD